MADPVPDDPGARLWTHALRLQIDALVTAFEAQLRQHVEATAGVHAREAAVERERGAVLQGRLDAHAARMTVAVADAQRLAAEASARETELTRVRDALVAREAELAQARRDLDTVTTALADREKDVARLESRLMVLGQQVQTLDEQFAVEKHWVLAALPAAGNPLFDLLQQSLGVPLAATPGCYGTLKARKPDVVLAQAVRDRGRTAGKSALTETEHEALRALAEASGCELVEPGEGVRFTPGTMEKSGTRPEPSEEDMVLACVMPGLRLAGTQGSLVHPRVVVGTA